MRCIGFHDVTSKRVECGLPARWYAWYQNHEVTLSYTHLCDACLGRDLITFALTNDLVIDIRRIRLRVE